MYEGQLLFNKFFEKLENLDFELWDIERDLFKSKYRKNFTIRCNFI